MDGTADLSVRLAPHAMVLRRSDSELQIGVEPCVVVPASYDRVVRDLAVGAPPHHLDETAVELGLGPQAVPDLLVALADAHLLGPPATTAAVRVVGVGPLGSRTAQ
ncbi:MAG: hypothetical protein EOP01_09835, partial [Propionibacteriaceae bacterium]